MTDSPDSTTGPTAGPGTGATTPGAAGPGTTPAAQPAAATDLTKTGAAVGEQIGRAHV